MKRKLANKKKEADIVQVVKTYSYSFFSIIAFSVIMILINFPIAFAICSDDTVTTFHNSIVLTSIPLIYGLICFLENKTPFLSSLLIGTSVAYIIYFISLILKHETHLIFYLINNGGITYYNYGLILPTLPHVYVWMKTHKLSKESTFIILPQLFILLLVLLSFLFDLFIDIKYAKHTTSYFAALLGLTLGIIIGSIVYYYVKKHLLQGIHVFVKVMRYMKVMIGPIVVFFSGYLSIIFLFAGIYSIINYLYPESFLITRGDTVSHFLYYSYTTLTGFGFTKIHPITPLALLATALENFIGIVWITIVFAATLGYLQEPFNALSRLYRKKNSDSKK